MTELLSYIISWYLYVLVGLLGSRWKIIAGKQIIIPFLNVLIYLHSSIRVKLSKLFAMFKKVEIHLTLSTVFFSYDALHLLLWEWCFLACTCTQYSFCRNPILFQKLLHNCSAFCSTCYYSAL